MSFGITPEQVAAIVALWRRCGREIADLDCGSGGAAAGSLAFENLADCRRTTRVATKARSAQLSALADALATFRALTVSADETAATTLAERRRS